MRHLVTVLLVLGLLGHARAIDVQTPTPLGTVTFDDYTTTNSLASLGIMLAPITGCKHSVALVCANTGANDAKWTIYGSPDGGGVGVVLVNAATLTNGTNTAYTALAYYGLYLIQAQSSVADTPTTLSCRGQCK